ncbi:MAG: Com family DNA-binding transcriptional regulator [Alphaproteobacteria bacterium]|nr:Com family DNA-binding transcriptional regulator [Alphaproteobacteria bacterium]
MESIRCGKCRNLLARAEGCAVEIKCPRCGTLNHVRAGSPPSERPRASTREENAHDSEP